MSAGSGPAWVRVVPRQCRHWCGLWARVGPRGFALVPASGQDLGLPGFFVFASHMHWDLGPVGLKIMFFFGKVAGERL